MLFLAKFVLKGQSQAALATSALAVLGLILPPVAWLSAAAVVLVTLVYGERYGLATIALSLIGSALFLYLIFSAPQAALIFVLLAWLPAWIVAVVLRNSVSLAMSLQVLTLVSLLAVAIVYGFFPQLGEYWRAPITDMIAKFVAASNEFKAEDIQSIQDWFVEFLPGLFIGSIMSGTVLSLLLGRWWQAVHYNPGGFATEFQRLNLGKTSAIVASMLVLLVYFMPNVITFSLLFLVVVLYSVQGMSLLHAIIRIRKVNNYWLFLVYSLMFFIPYVAILLVLIALVDPWLNLRQQLKKSDDISL